MDVMIAPGQLLCLHTFSFASATGTTKALSRSNGEFRLIANFKP